MKRISLLLIALFSVILTCYSQDETEVDEEQKPVTLNKYSIKQPRSGTTLEIDCYYYAGILTIEFEEFIESSIRVSVTNCATGEQYQIIEPIGSQVVSLYVPQTSGNYYVEIVLDTTMYYGYYNL